MPLIHRFSAFCLVLLLASLAVGDDPRITQSDLEKQLRSLEQEIEKVRGLKFKTRVVAQVIPRPRGANPGIQGYYDTKKKALFLYDDIKGNYAKGVLVHEMVHALQDQHFGLRKLHASTFGSDQEAALAALVEGDATLTMIELLQKEQPHVTKMLATDLSKAKNLRNAFLYGQGTRFVQEIRKKGGWKAVDMRYRFTPTSTAAILHPNERITPVNLGTGPRIGEFGLIRMLHGCPATQARSVEVASGWRGDRTIVHNKDTAWVVAFATEEQARRCFEALTTMQEADHPKDKRIVSEPTARIYADAMGDARRGLVLQAKRVWQLTAQDEAGFCALQDRVFGPPKMTVWSAIEKKNLSFGEFVDRLLQGDIICVGESHDSEIHHLVQLQIIKALFARDERLGVGMEMFQRPFQKSLDRYIAGAIDEPTFLEDSEYRTRWGYDWELYRPIVEFCRRNRTPLAALNLADEVRRRLSAVGFEKLTAEEKKQLGEVDFQVKEHRAYWFDKLGEMHGQSKMTPEGKEKFYQVMTAWDEYMADSAARFQKERKIRRMVILAGSGHIERGFGIPQRAAKRTGGKVLTVGVDLGGDVRKVVKDVVTDFVVIVE
jgi:uncharacterized iron-regulated protein